jgi:hypothetical protein
MKKKNISLLKYFFNNEECRSFDFSICKNKQLSTGYKLHYPSIKEFINIIPKKNIKKEKDHIYFEIIFGKKEVINKYLKLLENIKKNNSRNDFLKRVFNLDANFKNLNYSINIINGDNYK